MEKTFLMKSGIDNHETASTVIHKLIETIQSDNV